MRVPPSYIPQEAIEQAEATVRRLMRAVAGADLEDTLASPLEDAEERMANVAFVGLTNGDKVLADAPYAVKRALSAGLDPFTAVWCGYATAAQAHGLKEDFLLRVIHRMNIDQARFDESRDALIRWGMWPWPDEAAD